MIPEDWDVRPLGAIAQLYQPVTISAGKMTESGYPVYGANGIIGLYHSKNHSTSQTIITCRGSTCGMVNKTVDECWITGNAMVANCDNTPGVSKDFIYHALCFSDLDKCITGTGQPQIVRAPLAAYPLPLPATKAEQESIAVTLREIESNVSMLEHKLQKSRSIKQALMQELLTGRTRLI